MTTSDPARPTVVVVGQGRVERTADLADATFVVEATRPTAAEARAAAAAAVASVLAALEAAGVARTDLRTAGLDVQPAWDHEGNRPVRRGFTVTHRVGAAIKDLELVGRVVDAGLESGATGLDGVAFRLADLAPAEDEARRLAVADARTRASTIAAAADLALGALRAVAEGAPLPGPRLEGAGMLKAAFAADAAFSPTPVLPGRIEVSVAITAEWELD